MSRHYLEMAIRAFNGQAVDVNAMLAQLAQEFPDLAEQCAGIDWTALRVKCAKDAVRQVAEERAQFAETYDNKWGTYERDSGAPPNGGRCLGVITNGSGVSLGVSVDARGALSFFHNRYSVECGAAKVNEWQQAVEIRYRELAQVTVLKIVGEEVRVVRKPAETVILATLPEKEGGR